MTCGNLTTHKRNDISVFALAQHPSVILLVGNRCKADVYIKLRGLKQQLLHNLPRAVGRRHKQDAEGKRTVDVRLTDVKNKGVVAREYIRKHGCHTWLILARDIHLDNLNVVSFHPFPYFGYSSISFV